MSVRCCPKSLRGAAVLALGLGCAGQAHAQALSPRLSAAPLAPVVGSSPELEAPRQADPYAFVRGVLGASRDATGKALCEQHIKVVELGLPDPGSVNGTGSRFAQAAERAELLQMLYLGARSSDDPSRTAAYLFVLLGMLNGSNYVDTVQHLIDASAAQPTASFDCTRDYDAQPVERPPTGAPAFDVELHHQQYLTACSPHLSSEQLLDEQSFLVDNILGAIDRVYGPQFVPSTHNVGETSGGGSGKPAKYVATWTDAQGKKHVQALTDGYIGRVQHAHTAADRRAGAIDAVNTAAQMWNLGIGAVGRHVPIVGVFGAPDATILGTISTGVDVLNSAAKLGGADLASLAAASRALGWVSVAMIALESKDAMTKTQEGAESIGRLSPSREQTPQPIDVKKSEEVLSATVGRDVKIEPAPNQSTEPQEDDSPLMCPTTPSTPFGSASNYVDCDSAPGADEPIVPVSCQAVMDQAQRELRQGYEWLPEEPGTEELPSFDDWKSPCDDTGRNPSRCLPPEPGLTPIDLPVWDGKHYDQDSSIARGQLDGWLKDFGGTTTLPEFKPPMRERFPALPPGPWAAP